MIHPCHHPTCENEIPPRMFACAGHWAALPKRLRVRLQGAYVPGQETRKDPSREYLDAAVECRKWWNEHPGRSSLRICGSREGGRA